GWRAPRGMRRAGRAGAAGLARPRRRFRFAPAPAFDAATARAGWCGAPEFFSPPLGFEEKVARMEAVTPADIQRAAQEVFRPDRLVVAASGGLSEKQRKGLGKLVRTWR